MNTGFYGIIKLKTKQPKKEYFHGAKHTRNLKNLIERNCFINNIIFDVMKNFKFKSLYCNIKF